jgi:hypothetical protein
MKKTFIDTIVVAFSIALWYFSLFLGIFADFLFLGIGASASPQKPIFPIVLPVLHMIVATMLFVRRKIIDSLMVYIICLSFSLILLYVHVLSKI